MDITLMDMVITTIGVIVTMAILSCMCCICMKISDLKMKSCIIELAKQKGVMVDPDKLTSQQRESPHAAENCTIMIPDVAFLSCMLSPARGFGPHAGDNMFLGPGRVLPA